MHFSLYQYPPLHQTTHLLSGNVAQLVVCILLGAIFFQIYGNTVFQEGLKYLDKLTQGSQRWRLMLALIFGFVVGEASVIVIALSYVPSTVRAILQFRTGGYASLHSKQFLKLRYAVDESSILFGSIFWGTLYTSIIIGVSSMVVLAIILWPDFGQLVLLLFANIVGICITMLMKWILLIFFRRKCQAAYYRRSVWVSNLVGVILESWVSELHNSVGSTQVLFSLLSPARI